MVGVCFFYDYEMNEGCYMGMELGVSFYDGNDSDAGVHRECSVYTTPSRVRRTRATVKEIQFRACTRLENTQAIANYLVRYLPNINQDAVLPLNLFFRK